MVEILVSKDKCPLEAIVEMQEWTKNAWIFLNNEAIEWLKGNAITINECNGYTFNTGGRIVRVCAFINGWQLLKEVTKGNGIPEFKELPENPNRIILVKKAK